VRTRRRQRSRDVVSTAGDEHVASQLKSTLGASRAGMSDRKNSDAPVEGESPAVAVAVAVA
jgi:hypothetical protein